MTLLRCQHRLLLLRVLVLAVFALRLVLQPGLATVGEMHELAHDPSGMHAPDAHADDGGAALAVSGDQDEGAAQVLHALLHFAHCCGATATLPAALRPILAMSATGPLAVASVPIPPQPRLVSPFKPPIFA